MDLKNTKTRQWVVAISTFGVLFTGTLALAYFARDTTPKLPAKKHAPERIDLTPKSLTETHFVAHYEAKMGELTEDLKAVKAELAAAREREARRNVKDPYALTGPVEDGTPLQNLTIAPNAKDADAQAVERRRLSILKTRKPLPEDEKPKVEPAGRFPKNLIGREEALQLIPSGTFAKAVLLNGVEAPTGGQANGNPMPLVMELTDRAVLPNRFTSDIKRCFVTANATGDLSSERVLIRLDRLSCLDEHGGAVDVKLTGYVAGEDGKTGVRARVVTRSGQAIANALLVGTLSGLGQAVSLAAQDSTTHFSGSVTTNVENPWKAGLGDGMKDAMDRIADYYLRLADKIFPVLEIDAGREVEIVVTQSASIRREPRDE